MVAGFDCLTGTSPLEADAGLWRPLSKCWREPLACSYTREGGCRATCVLFWRGNRSPRRLPEASTLGYANCSESGETFKEYLRVHLHQAKKSQHAMRNMQNAAKTCSKTTFVAQQMRLHIICCAKKAVWLQVFAAYCMLRIACCDFLA